MAMMCYSSHSNQKNNKHRINRPIYKPADLFVLEWDNCTGWNSVYYLSHLSQYDFSVVPIVLTAPVFPLTQVGLGLGCQPEHPRLPGLLFFLEWENRAIVLFVPLVPVCSRRTSGTLSQFSQWDNLDSRTGTSGTHNFNLNSVPLLPLGHTGTSGTLSH